MKNYSKSGLKKKRLAKSFVIFFSILLVISLGLLAYIFFKSSIVIEKVDESSNHVSDNVAINSNPVIINNVLLGAIYDRTWVSSERYYLNSKNKSNVEIDAYNKNGRAGTYTISSMSKDASSSAVYCTTTNTNYLEEYIAVASNDRNSMGSIAKRNLNVSDEDIKLVKKALGKYRLFNSSIKISEVYDVQIEKNGYGKIIIATNESGKSSGAYSSVIYVSPLDKTRIIKYSYIKNLKDASDWPIYSFKFLTDLNGDGMSEIILQETTEFEVKYDVIEYRENKFYEVLSTTIKI